MNQEREIEKLRKNLQANDFGSFMCILFGGAAFGVGLILPSFISIIFGISFILCVYYRYRANKAKATLLVQREYKAKFNRAREREHHLDYKKAIEIYEEIGRPEEAARVRRRMYDEKKVDQTVVQGDQVTKTEIKDSVLNRSNIGSSGDDKFARLEKLTEMKKEGMIDDGEFKQMKKDILG